MIDIQKLIDVIRPGVSGRNKANRARFHTSDVTQECAVQLIKEFEKEDRKDPRITKSWLKKIGYGTSAKMHRKNAAECRSAKRESGDDVAFYSEPQATPAELAEYREIQANLVIALTKLDREEHELIDAVYNNNQSLNQFAKSNGLTYHCARKVHAGALQKIKDEMGA